MKEGSVARGVTDETWKTKGLRPLLDRSAVTLRVLTVEG